MNTMEVIRTRRSVRTFDGRKLVPEDLEKLQAFIGTIANPYGIPVEFFRKTPALRLVAGNRLYMDRRNNEARAV